MQCQLSLCGKNWNRSQCLVAETVVAPSFICLQIFLPLYYLLSSKKSPFPLILEVFIKCQAINII
jgi:hypothetical protein